MSKFITLPAPSFEQFFPTNLWINGPTSHDYTLSRLHELGITPDENHLTQLASPGWQQEFPFAPLPEIEKHLGYHFLPDEQDNILINYVDFRFGRFCYYRRKGNKWQHQFVRTRLKVPIKNLNQDKDKWETIKYLTPKGAPNLPYFNGIYQFFTRSGTLGKIKTLVATEGEFKAFKACKHGIPCVGGAGVHNLVGAVKAIRNGKETTVDARFLPELADFIGEVKPGNFIFLLDADCFANYDYEKERPNYSRAMAMYSAVRNAFLAAKKAGIRNFVFAWINREAGGKGLDDVLVAHPGEEEKIRAELLDTTQLKGKYFCKQVLRRSSDLVALREIFEVSTQRTEYIQKYIAELQIKLRGKDLLIAPTGAGKDDFVMNMMASISFAMLMPNNLPIAEKAEKYNNPAKNRNKLNLELVAYDQFTDPELKKAIKNDPTGQYFKRFVTTYQSAPQVLPAVDRVVCNEVHKITIQPFEEPRKTFASILASDKKQLHLTGTPFHSFCKEFSDINVIRIERLQNNPVHVRCINLSNGKGSYNMLSAFDLYYEALRLWIMYQKTTTPKVYFVYINHKEIIDRFGCDKENAIQLANQMADSAARLAAAAGFDTDRMYSNDQIKENSYLNRCLVNGEYIQPLTHLREAASTIDYIAEKNPNYGNSLFENEPEFVYRAVKTGSTGETITRPLICFITSIAIDNVDYFIEDKYLGGIWCFGEKYVHQIIQLIKGRCRNNTIEATWVLVADYDSNNGDFVSYEAHRRQFEQRYEQLVAELRQNPVQLGAKIAHDKEFAEKWTIEASHYIDKNGQMNRLQCHIDYEVKRNLWQEKNYQKFNALAPHVTTLEVYDLDIADLPAFVSQTPAMPSLAVALDKMLTEQSSQPQLREQQLNQQIRELEQTVENGDFQQIRQLSKEIRDQLNKENLHTLRSYLPVNPDHNQLSQELKLRRESAIETLREAFLYNIKNFGHIHFCLAMMLERRISGEMKQELREAFDFDYATFKDYDYKEFKENFLPLFDRNCYEFLLDKLLRLAEMSRFFVLDQALVELVFDKKFKQFERQLTIAFYLAGKLNSPKSLVNGQVVKAIIAAFSPGEKCTNEQIKTRIQQLCRRQFRLEITEHQALQVFSDCFLAVSNIEKVKVSPPPDAAPPDRVEEGQVQSRTSRTKEILDTHQVCALACQWGLQLAELRALPIIKRTNTFGNVTVSVNNTAKAPFTVNSVTYFTEKGVTGQNTGYSATETDVTGESEPPPGGLIPKAEEIPRYFWGYPWTIGPPDEEEPDEECPF